MLKFKLLCDTVLLRFEGQGGAIMHVLWMTDESALSLLFCLLDCSAATSMSMAQAATGLEHIRRLVCNAHLHPDVP